MDLIVPLVANWYITESKNQDIEEIAIIIKDKPIKALLIISICPLSPKQK